VKAFSDLIRPRGMKLHMDGARFANAVAGLGCTPAELTWKAGVDVMSFGATKNGAMMLEAVVFFDLGLAEDFAYRRMRGGQLLSKSRYLGAQMIAYLENGLWLENAKRANALAQRLAKGLTAGGKVRIPNPVQANEVFAVLPRAMFDRLQARVGRNSTTGCRTALAIRHAGGRGGAIRDAGGRRLKGPQRGSAATLMGEARRDCRS